MAEKQFPYLFFNLERSYLKECYFHSDIHFYYFQIPAYKMKVQFLLMGVANFLFYLFFLF